MPDPARLSELLLRWEDLRAQGRDLSAEELCRDCPEQAPEVDRRLAALRAVYQALDTASNGLAGAEPATLQPGEPVPLAPQATPPPIPGYVILKELGRGGMGVVYQARQVTLNRLVAMKIILADGYAGPEELARFRFEAQAVARLQHPNIVQVHEVGQAEGKPFFSLEYVEGGSLDRKLQGTPQPPREAAALVETLARAVDAAHQKGIIHRDLKPANVLLTADGTPKVTDFGLAKRLLCEPGRSATGVLPGEPGPSTTGVVTRSGAVLGTPSYMAPEQADGKPENIGPATDVYALGAILYELLTGRPPFKGATPMDTIMQVVANEPVPPGQFQPKVPRDLEMICLKALSKTPLRRYATAQALGEDLNRFLRGEPVLARPVGRPEKLWRWCRRNPGLAVAGSLAIAALLAGTIVSSIFAFHAYQAADREARVAAKEARTTNRLRQEQKTTKAALSRFEKQKEATRAALRQAETERDRTADRLAQIYLERGLVACTKDANPALGLHWLGRALDTVPARDLHLRAVIQTQWAGWKTHVLPLKNLSVQRGKVQTFAFSPDGRNVLIATEDNTVRLWSPVSGKETTLTRKRQVLAAAFSSDGKMVLTGGLEHTELERPTASGRTVVFESIGDTARLWSVTTGKEITPPLRHQSFLGAVAFSPDGRRVLTGSYDHTARQWSVLTGKPITPPLRHQREVVAVAFSPDGKLILTGSWDNTARLWSAATGKETIPPLRHQAPVYRVTFSPDGKTVLTCSEDNTARLWSAATGKEITAPLRHQSKVDAVAFSPDGKLILTGSRGNTARLWSASTGKEAVPSLGNLATGAAVAFSPDGQTVLTGGDRAARLWSAATGQPIAAPLAHQDSVRAVAFSPDGKTVLTAGDRVVRAWSITTGNDLAPPLAHQDGGVRAVAISPDGKTILTGSGLNTSGAARLWSAATSLPITGPLRHEKPVVAVAFSPNGRTVVTASWDKTARLWSVATGNEITPPLRHQGEVVAVAFSPDGKTVLTGSFDGTARLWSASTGKEMIPPLRGLVTVIAVAFSPDGETVLTAGESGALLWSAATGRQITPLLPHQGVKAAVFSPDGRTVVTAGQDTTARLWSTTTGKQLTAPLRHQDQVVAAAFSPDGKKVLTASRDSARLWSAATGKELTRPLHHQGSVVAVAFSPDGKTVLTGSYDQTARLWSAATGQELAPPMAHQNGVCAVAFGPDGQTVITGGGRTVRVWRIPPFSRQDPACTRLWTQVITGTELDDHGDLRFLDAQTWHERCRQLRHSTASPMAAENDSFWHRRQAIEAQLAGQWFAALWHLDRLLAANPSESQFWADRGQAHAQLAQWQEASRDYARACQLGNPDLQVWFNHACLRLYLGDEKTYRQVCETLLARQAATNNPADLNDVAAACSLAPRAVPNLERIVRLAEKPFAKDPDNPAFLQILCAALYRAGYYEEAVDRLQDAIVKSSETTGAVINWLFLAMARQKLGQVEEARTCLAKAEVLMKAPGMPWPQRLQAQLLYREAEAIVKGPKH
jgi:WD40 repeat protein/tetratricopeptide (TPR) repeat protein